MNPGVYVAIYLPIFILLFVILPAQEAQRRAAFRHFQKKRGVKRMTNEMVEKLIGKECLFSMGWGLGGVSGKVLSVADGWIEVQTKKGIQMLNAEMVSGIQIKT